MNHARRLSTAYLACTGILAALCIMMAIRVARFHFNMRYPPHSAVAETSAPVGGTIYFQTAWVDPPRLYRMRSDGTEKTALPAGVVGQPSHRLHEGHRWFLDVRVIAGETYPDGGTRRELFAIRSDGMSIQLTDQPSLEPAPLTPRWPIHAGDRMVSWIARRWSPVGQVTEGGIYAAKIEFGPYGDIAGIVANPDKPVVPSRLLFDQSNVPRFWWRMRAPDVLCHDWSPDGRVIVYESARRELYVVDTRSGKRKRLTEQRGRDPVWSPDGARIAFRASDPCQLAVVARDRCEIRTIGGRPGVAVVATRRPIWSPTGTHIVLQCVNHVINDVGAPCRVDIFRVALDGREPVNLTADISQFVDLVAWRADASGPERRSEQ